MILEGLVTTRHDDGSVNVAPMGPIVDESMDWLRLRPFRTSNTFRNLQRTRCGVFHVTDDVLLLARAAIGPLNAPPELRPAKRIDGDVLASACRWYEFEVVEIDDRDERTAAVVRVVHRGRLRDFFGFNRAKHAVVEAAILATRVHILPRDEVDRQLDALRLPVEKTAGPQERAAFDLLERHIAAAERP